MACLFNSLITTFSVAGFAGRTLNKEMESSAVSSIAASINQQEALTEEESIGPQPIVKLEVAQNKRNRDSY